MTDRHEPAGPSSLLCLKTALAALLSVGLGCAGIEGFVRSQLRAAMDRFALTMAPVKLTGNVLQTTAFRSPGFLPIYGSSELDHSAENRPDTFFLHRPTGFEAFPIGKAGNTCLVILEKIAAAGDSVRGKKVAIFLSPSWFLRDASAGAVASNLRPLQLGKWVFDGRLSEPLRRDIARRLIRYPRALENQPLLARALADLAADSPLSRARLALLTPIGRGQNFFLERMEYWALQRDLPTTWTSPRQRRQENRRPDLAPPTTTPAWSQLAIQAEAHDRALGDASPFNVGPSHRDDKLPHRAAPNEETEAAEDEPMPSSEQDVDFAKKLARSSEWTDLSLLLRVLRELDADALIVSQPFNGVYRDLGGNTPGSRRAYYDRLGAAVRAAGFTGLDFSEHEEDRTFFNDAGHPSSKAWIFYDHALDDFYHWRRAREAGAG